MNTIGDMPMPEDFRYRKIVNRGKPQHRKFDDFWMRHPTMDIGHRAKIFSPYDALKGFSDAVASKEVVYVDRIELNSEDEQELNERLGLLQVVFRVVFVDTCKEVVVLRVVGDHLQAVVAAIAEGSADDVAGVLLALAVQREHHFGMVGMRVTCAVLVDDDLLAGRQRFLHQAALVGPRTIEVAQPHVTAAYGQHGRRKGGQRDGLLLAVGHLGPGLNDILLEVGFILQFHREGIDGVFERNTGDEIPLVHDLALLVVVADERCRHVAVGMAYCQSGFSGSIQAVGGIGLHASVDRLLKVLQLLCTQSLAEIDVLRLLPFGDIKH